MSKWFIVTRVVISSWIWRPWSFQSRIQSLMFIVKQETESQLSWPLVYVYRC